MSDIIVCLCDCRSCCLCATAAPPQILCSTIRETSASTAGSHLSTHSPRSVGLFSFSYSPTPFTPKRCLPSPVRLVGLHPAGQSLYLASHCRPQPGWSIFILGVALWASTRLVNLYTWRRICRRCHSQSLLPRKSS